MKLLFLISREDDNRHRVLTFANADGGEKTLGIFPYTAGVETDIRGVTKAAGDVSVASFSSCCFLFPRRDDESFSDLSRTTFDILANSEHILSIVRTALLESSVASRDRN